MSDKSVLVNFDESGYLNECNNLDNGLIIIKPLIEKYNALNFGKVTNKEFKIFFSNTDIEGFIYDEITSGKPIQINGLEINKNKAFEMLKKPVGYEGFINQLSSTIEQLNIVILYGNHPLHKSIVTDYYEINNDGEVIIKDSVLTSLKSKFMFYATSDVAIKIVDLVNTIIDKCNDEALKKISLGNPNGFARFLSDLFNTEHYNKAPSLNLKAISHYNRNKTTYIK